MLSRAINKRRLRRMYTGSPLEEGLGITIRFAYPDDADAVARLAALDSKNVPPGPLLVAEVDGELWAAVSVASRASVIADPFRHTAELANLLRQRADALAHIPRRTATRSRQGDALPLAQGGLRRA